MLLKIGITGHRLLKEPEEVKKAIRKKVKELLREKNTHDFEGYSALASGADMLFAQVVLELGGKLQVVLPFDKKKYEEDFFTDEKKEFNTLLQKAYSTNTLTVTDPDDEAKRNKGYLDCGIAIANKCDVMIAVWNGEKESGVGGTESIVNYIKKESKRAEIIPATKFKNDLEWLQKKREQSAERSKINYHRYWRVCILLGIGAGTLLAISISFHLPVLLQAIFSSVELGLVLIAVGFILVLRKGHLKKNRIVNRREAERLRVLNELYAGGFKMQEGANLDFITEDVKKLEMKYIRRTGRSYQTLNLASAKEILMSLIDGQLKYHGVIREEDNNRPLHMWEWIQKTLLILFAVFVALHVYSNWAKVANENCSCGCLPEIPHWAGLFFSLIIPPIYAGIEGYIYFREFKRNKTDSSVMKTFFEEKKKLLETIDVDTPTARTEIIKMANEVRFAMDEENINWAHTISMQGVPGPG